MHVKLLALLVVTIALKLCSTAPSDGRLSFKSDLKLDSQESSHEYDEDVEELHDLVTNKSRTVEKHSKLATSDIDSAEQTTADDDDRKTDSDSSSQDSDLTSNFHDTPRDMAEYVFWTGDRKSITKTVEDFVNQGLMNSQEASHFLEQVQSQLQDIQERYGVRDSGIKKTAPATAASKAAGEIIVTNVNFHKKLSEKLAASKEQKDQPLMKDGAVNNGEENGGDEAGLGKIIYQLSRILFTQSLQGGKTSAQNSLQKFAEFLEKGSQDGKLSPELQKKVLNLLLTSLSDTMAEQKDSKQHLDGKLSSSVKSVKLLS